MKGAFERDDAVPLRISLGRMVLARHLDGAFHGFGTGIAEEYQIRKACGAEPGRKALGLGNAIEIRNMR